MSEEVLQELIDEVLAESKDQLVQDYVNGRVEVARRAGKAGSLNLGQLAVEAKNVVQSRPSSTQARAF